MHPIVYFKVYLCICRGLQVKSKPYVSGAKSSHKLTIIDSSNSL